MIEDLRAGARILRDAPGLSAAAILLIALVVGGNATVYSTVNSILVSPASAVQGEELVVIRHVDPAVNLSDPFVSFPNFEDYVHHATTVVGLAAWTSRRLTFGTPFGNFAVFGGLVTTNFFQTFGVAVAHGRDFVTRDESAQDGLVVILSHRMWIERFGQAADIVGRSVTVDGVPATVVGVAAPGFAGVTLTPVEDLWMPIRGHARAAGSGEELANRAQPSVLMAGRLAPSVSLAEARSEFATLATQLQNTYPDAFTTYSPHGVVALRNARAVVSRYSATALLPIAQMAPVFLAVFSAVTLITLVVVCANVANLLLGRSVERQRDIAVRQALGASRAHITRMLIAEGGTLAVAAWIAAYVIAWWTSRALLRFVEPVPGLLANARPDWTLTVYSMVLAMLSTLACSIAPAMQLRKIEALPFLKAGEHGIARGGSRLATTLVVVQFAFSALLVATAGLAYRSMTSLSSADLGFKPGQLLLVTVRLSAHERVADREGLAILERVRAELAATPTVEAVSYARRIPGATLLTPTPIRRDTQTVSLGFVRQVGPDYLRVLGLQVTAGRELTTVDRLGAPRVAVVSQRLALELFGHEPPVGHAVFVGDKREPFEIAGVAPDALFDGPNRDPHPRYLFVAEQQTQGSLPVDSHFLIRHRGDDAAFAPVASRAIKQADAALPIVSMTTMSDRLASVTELETVIMELVASFSVLALVIAALGQYAAAMFHMRRRTREFGVRMALGASAGTIAASVVREAIRHAVIGLTIGLALSGAVAAGFNNLLFGVAPFDPVTYLGVAMLLAVTSVIASYLPARRAARVNVVDSLRQE